MILKKGSGMWASMLLAVVLVLANAAVAETGMIDTVAVERGESRTVLVDINKADEAGLQAIPGIGPALSKRIVDFREANGPYRRVEDIMKVRGIGEKSFQKIKSFIKVEPVKK